MEFSGAQPDVDLTYSDVFLVPRHSEVGSRLSVDLAPGDGSAATLPLVSANMNSVTGPRLAATLARRGGLGVLPQDLALPRLVEAVGWGKAQPVAWDAALVFPPSATVAEARRVLPAVPGRGIVVADQPRGRQLRVALDQLDAEAGGVRDGAQERGLAGAGRALEHDVAAARQRGGEHLRLAPQADDALVDRGEQGAWVSARGRSLHGCSCRRACPGSPR